MARAIDSVIIVGCTLQLPDPLYALLVHMPPGEPHLPCYRPVAVAPKPAREGYQRLSHFLESIEGVTAFRLEMAEVVEEEPEAA